MPKKETTKSTVIAMRDEFDWGKTLYNACFIFNQKLADYWREYAMNYEKKREEIIKSEEETKRIIKKRNSIIDEKARLKSNTRDLSFKVTDYYRKYIKALPIGDCVSEYRLNKFSESYTAIINERKQHYNNYNQCYDLKQKSLIIENDYKNEHLFETRELNSKVKSLNKLIELHKLELDHPITEDIDVLYDFITSEKQIERLMSVCINILETYSEKEFSTMMYVKDRENIANYIFDYFENFNHNYDFISGCYELKEDNKLHLKDLKTLENKFYNGYYLTIRGFVQRSYAEGRNEHFNIKSADENWQNDNDNTNHGIDMITDTEKEKGGYTITQREGFTDGMYDFWGLCKSFLNNHLDEMAVLLKNKMINQFPKMNYYKDMSDNTIMINLLSNVLNGIDGELIKGNNVSVKLKHIILDSMGGAETKEEWNKCSTFIISIIKEYMKKFFVENRTELYDDIFEKDFNDKEWQK